MIEWLYICAYFLCSYVQAGTVMNNYAHIFDLLTRLRQVNDYLMVDSRVMELDTTISVIDCLRIICHG